MLRLARTAVRQYDLTKAWAQARFTNSERGANMVEYILLVGLIALFLIGIIVVVSGQIGDKFTQAGDEVEGAGD